MSAWGASMNTFSPTASLGAVGMLLGDDGSIAACSGSVISLDWGYEYVFDFHRNFWISACVLGEAGSRCSTQSCLTFRNCWNDAVLTWKAQPALWRVIGDEMTMTAF